MFDMIPDWLRREIQYKWERLELRKWLNANPRIVVSIACAAVLLLLVTLGLLMSGNPPVKVEEYQKGWYYDSNSGKLFVDRMDKPQPVQAPSEPSSAESQPAAVKAYVFTYADEPNESERFIGFLVMPDPNVSLSADISHLSGVRRWGHGKLIRRPADDEWVPADSPEGHAILKGLLFPDESGKIACYCPAE